MELIDFEWWRCCDGYELVEATSSAGASRWKTTPDSRTPNFVIASKSKRFELYRPLSKSPVLFDIFARKPSTPKGMLKFCNEFGLLGSEAFAQPPVSRKRPTMERQGLGLESHARLRQAVLSFEHDNISAVIGLYNWDGLAKASIRLQQKSDGTIGIALVPGSLIQAMWLQFALHVSSGIGLIRCERCSNPFVVGAGTGRRNTSKYCSNACKVAAFKIRKTIDDQTHVTGKTGQAPLHTRPTGIDKAVQLIRDCGALEGTRR
jgi:hypothetical protein